ncbi:Do family serine endopeptidase [Acuticoccus mangrovi]|uniref:PDZ domain-containing protein n=1 Tax=Acuticoccus mangrovi TaxID=2796142 RepID=A0A934ITP8_9HYPH|nr:hypothetical protein [Acuticoccus mangrovi]MBJ3778641.1 hypothetical protein [Acuticoccus mangrovi]
MLARLTAVLLLLAGSAEAQIKTVAKLPPNTKNVFTVPELGLQVEVVTKRAAGGGHYHSTTRITAVQAYSPAAMAGNLYIGDYITGFSNIRTAVASTLKRAQKNFDQSERFPVKVEKQGFQGNGRYDWNDQINIILYTESPSKQEGAPWFIEKGSANNQFRIYVGQQQGFIPDDFEFRPESSRQDLSRYENSFHELLQRKINEQRDLLFSMSCQEAHAAMPTVMRELDPYNSVSYGFGNPLLMSLDIAERTLCRNEKFGPPPPEALERYAVITAKTCEDVANRAEIAEQNYRYSLSGKDYGSYIAAMIYKWSDKSPDLQECVRDYFKKEWSALLE